ncbi:hypothetical protein ATANTOWER_022461, partial [Ataeniobius toweri]|nr:hypothetical protein [Ataeniobius toweri]
GDYVTEREAWPGRGQYDVIICLGVTKWVQLQSGDRGVVRLFRRAYQSLSPGGVLILEPQSWSSYVHSKRASETTIRNFRTLRIRPELFTSFLTDSVGFSSYRLLTHTGVNGFNRGGEPLLQDRTSGQNLCCRREPQDRTSAAGQNLRTEPLLQVTRDPSTCSTRAPPTGSDIVTGSDWTVRPRGSDVISLDQSDCELSMLSVMIS